MSRASSGFPDSWPERRRVPEWLALPPVNWLRSTIAALSASVDVLGGRFPGWSEILPTEIEAVLQAHEKIADAAVVARPDTNGEQELAAYVVAKAEITAGQLLAHCRRRLTPYKISQQIHIVAELPRNSSGKVDKCALANNNASEN